jgi:hypothetical protein
MGNGLNSVKATVNDFYWLGFWGKFGKLSQFGLVTFVNVAVGFLGITAPAFSQTYNQETQPIITPIQPSIVPIQPRITPVDLQKNQFVQPRNNQLPVSPVPPAQSNMEKPNDELPILIYRCSNPVTCQLPLISI